MEAVYSIFLGNRIASHKYKLYIKFHRRLLF